MGVVARPSQKGRHICTSTTVRYIIRYTARYSRKAAPYVREAPLILRRRHMALKKPSEAYRLGMLLE